MQNNPYVLIQQIESANSWDEIESYVNDLVGIGVPSVKALLEKMPTVVTARLHSVGAMVFARVGYPANLAALAFMVSDASNFHSATYDESRDALLSIGEPVLPIIEDALKFYRRDKENYVLEIESLEEIENTIHNPNSL